MSADYTAEIVPLTRAQLDWLGHALANVQLRCYDEQSAHLSLVSKVKAYDKREPNVVVMMTPIELMVALWASHEGRIRNNAERMIRGELQRLFERLSGCKGINDAS